MGGWFGKPGTIGLDLGEASLWAAQRHRDGRLLTACLPRPNPSVPVTEGELVQLVGVMRRRGLRGRTVVVAAPALELVSTALSLPPRSSGAPVESIASAELAQRCGKGEPVQTAFWEVPMMTRPEPGTPAMGVALPTARAEALVRLVASAGLDVAAIDTRGWAIARHVSQGDATPDGVIVALELSWGYAAVVLVRDGVVVYERSLPGCGFEKPAGALAQGFGLEPLVVEYALDRLGLTPFTAGSPDGGETATDGGGAVPVDIEDDGPLRSAATGALEPWADALVSELQMSVSYAEHRYPDSACSLAVVGRGARVAGLVEWLRAGLSLPAAAGEPDRRADPEDPAAVIAAGLASHPLRREAA